MALKNYLGDDKKGMSFQFMVTVRMIITVIVKFITIIMMIIMVI